MKCVASNQDLHNKERRRKELAPKELVPNELSLSLSCCRKLYCPLPPWLLPNSFVYSFPRIVLV